MYWSRPSICSLYPCINRYCQWTDDIWIYDIIESGTLFLSSSLLLPILFPFFVSCPFPFSAFVLNFPLSQSPAVLPICIFQVFYMYCFLSFHLPILIPLPFSFHLFLHLYFFLNLSYHGNAFISTPVLLLLLALTLPFFCSINMN